MKIDFFVKAIGFINTSGNTLLGEGSETIAVQRMINWYGIVPAEAYLGSNMMALKPDYGKLNFKNLKEVADYKLPVKIGKTLEGEDVYQMKPFLTIHREPQDLRGTRLGGGRKKRRTVKKKRK